MRSSGMMNASDYLTTVAFVLSVMAAVAVIEVAIPLFVRPATPSRRRRANLAMTLQALLFAFVLTAAAAVLPFASPGLMASIALPATAQLVLGIVALDFAYGYLAHRTMHMAPVLWRFHRVHHSDPFVDVTTSFRTHPVEIAWRHLWLLATVWILGVPALAVVTFRMLSAVNGIFEHANIRVRPAVDTALSWVWVTPQMHKVHHSRDQAETDTNYGNLLALPDRLFGTFVPTTRALSVKYGLDDVDPAENPSFAALLAMPWRSRNGGDPAPGRLDVRTGPNASTQLGG